MPVQPDHILASSTPVSDFMINAFCARDRLTPHDPIARESLAGSHQAALDYWLNLSVQDAIPSFSDFKLIELGRYAERVILTDVSHDPEIDFRFRFFGTHVDERVSEQYTDKRLAEFERCGPDSNIWKVYETVVRSRAPLISQFEYVGLIPDIKRAPANSTCHWWPTTAALAGSWSRSSSLTTSRSPCSKPVGTSRLF